MAKNKRKNYTPEQKAELVAEVDRRYSAGNVSYKAVTSELGISESNYFAWSRAGYKPAPAPAQPNRKPRTPAEREQLVAQVERLRDAGLSAKAACKQVGIGHDSYCKWREPKAMRPVEVTALVPAALSALAIVPPQPALAPEPERLTLVAPGGYRIEGLGVESAAALLKALA